MNVSALSRRGTIRGRLTLGFTALIALLLVAGVLARRTMTQMSAAIDATLHADGSLDVQRAGIIRTARKLFDGIVFPR